MRTSWSRQLENANPGFMKYGYPDNLVFSNLKPGFEKTQLYLNPGLQRNPRYDSYKKKHNFRHHL
jgi:hypothetical protein